jgi:hypothetical protein
VVFKKIKIAHTTKVYVAQSSTSRSENMNFDKIIVEVGTSDKLEEIWTVNWLVEEEVSDEEQQVSKLVAYSLVVANSIGDAFVTENTWMKKEIKSLYDKKILAL